MTQYSYRAVLARTGETKAGVIDATSQVAALDALRHMGLLPLETKEWRVGIAAPRPQRSGAASRKAATNVIGELAVLVEAGLPLDRALAVLIEHMTQPAIKAAFATVRERVKSGASLARAFQEGQPLFPPMAAALAEAGEASGKLGLALKRLAGTLEHAEALREKVTSALIYPVMLLCVAFGVILIMLLLVIPQFETMFSEIGGKLPLATMVLISISQFLRSYGVVVLAAILGLLFAVRYYLRRPSARARLDRAILRLPLFGDLVVRTETARFARTLATLIDSGVPVVSALGIARRVIANSHMGDAVRRAAEDVKEGGSLARKLAATGVFPSLALSFLRTGEETAQLGLMLDRLADVLDREVQTATQRILAVMTPAITVFLGITVAGIIACIMSAILGINDLAVQS